MRAYTEPIMTAVLVFPFIAAMITLPYMVYQYRRYGAILLLRTALSYSFILYLMCAYFLTMLPLPSVEVVAGLTTPYLQLVPFTDWVLWIRNSGFVLSDPSTWKGLIINRDLFVLLANIVMTIPFGIYMRYYFGYSLRKTLLLSLSLSLVFELTQLSALFGLYPRPYRLCETDDLITNTLGGVLGYFLASPLMRFLPSRERMDEVAYRRGMHVSVTRRVTAAIVDWFVLGIALLFLLPSTSLLLQRLSVEAPWNWVIALMIIYAGLVLGYFVLGQWLQKGFTLGKRLTHLRLIDQRDGRRPKFWQLLTRYAIIYFIFLPLPAFAMVALLFAFRGEQLDILLVSVFAILMLFFAAGLIWVFLGVINRSNQMPHGALSQTRNISTLPVTEDMLGKVGQPLGENQELLPPEAAPGPMLNE